MLTPALLTSRWRCSSSEHRTKTFSSGDKIKAEDVKYFHLHTSFASSVNIFYTKKSFLCLIGAPRGAAMLGHSLPVESRKE